MERVYIEVSKEKQSEYAKMNKDTEMTMKKAREEKLIWES